MPKINAQGVPSDDSVTEATEYVSATGEVTIIEPPELVVPEEQEPEETEEAPAPKKTAKSNAR